MKKLGVVIIVVGLAMAAFTGFGFFTREKVVDVGSVEIHANKRHDLQWSPILGIVTAAVGVGIFFFGTRKTSQ